MKLDEDQVLAQALRLSSSARAKIAGQLLRSLDEDDEDDPAVVQAAWTAELEQRRRELAAGDVQPMTPDEALRFIASDDPYDVAADGEAEILAIAHDSRRPGYWRRRGPR